MPNWNELGMGAAANVANTAIGAGLGLILEKHNDKRQLNQQAKLQAMQIQGQKDLTDYNTGKQMEMWRNTSYPAQMEMLKQAGLNPGLIYGMGGGGGQSTNIAQGNVAGADAPKGGGEAMGMGMQMMQAQAIQSQIELTKAQTEKTKAEAGAIPTSVAKQQAEISSIAQGITNQKAAAELMELDAQLNSVRNKIATESMNDQIATIKYTMESAQAAVGKMENERSLTGTEAKWKEQQIKYSLANIAIDTYLKSKEAEGITQAMRESLDRMKTNFQNRLMQSEQQSNENWKADSEILNQEEMPEGVRAILNAIGIGAALRSLRHGTAGESTPYNHGVNIKPSYR